MKYLRNINLPSLATYTTSWSGKNKIAFLFLRFPFSDFSDLSQRRIVKPPSRTKKRPTGSWVYISRGACMVKEAHALNGVKITTFYPCFPVYRFGSTVGLSSEDKERVISTTRIRDGDESGVNI